MIALRAIFDCKRIFYFIIIFSAALQIDEVVIVCLEVQIDNAVRFWFTLLLQLAPKVFASSMIIIAYPTRWAISHIFNIKHILT